MKFLNALEIITRTVLSGCAPWGMTGDGRRGTILASFGRRATATAGKKKKGTKNKRPSHMKKVGEPITDMDIFQLIYPNGYKKNLIIEDEDGHNLHSDPADDADPFDDEQDNDDSPRCLVVKPKKKKSPHEFFVTCRKCTKDIGANSETHYTNPASHARTCYGADNIHKVNHVCISLMVH